MSSSTMTMANQASAAVYAAQIFKWSFVACAICLSASIGFVFAVAAGQSRTRDVQLKFFDEARNRYFMSRQEHEKTRILEPVFIEVPPISITQPYIPGPLKYSVFFSNGASDMDAALGARIELLFRGTARCRGGLLRITGWASSAPWRQDVTGFDTSNVELAHQRRDAVVRRIREVAPSAWTIDSVAWKNAAEMHEVREISDARSTERETNPLEFFNRRADIEILTVPTC